MAPLWMAANGSYNYSLSLTSVASSTILSATSSLFTFVFAVLAGVEKFEWLKLAGVVLCIAGSVMVTMDDSSGGRRSDDHTGWEKLSGDLLALGSAVFYGLYTLALRMMIKPGREDQLAMPLVFGYLGAFNFMIASPVLVVLMMFRVVSLDGLTILVFVSLVCKGLFDNVLSDYLWGRAVLLTSATVATVGLSLTIPMAFVYDIFFKDLKPDFLLVSGSLCVLLGFFCVNDVFHWCRGRPVSPTMRPEDNPLCDSKGVQELDPTLDEHNKSTHSVKT
eukprot:TRINITY_DN2693_c0_g2_i2.p1 TRINITY_DN2693_c0_g2~~TRINITY_DN2693_c0_g2_i2.p1  ORF type:complete len:277 (-),score=34.42 TRINITY_DN2693_c0_g2_i2:223-1053(-)